MKINHKINETFSVRVIDKQYLSEVVQVWRLSENYALLEGGNPDFEAEAVDFFERTSPQRMPEEKHTLGVFEGEKCVGLVDFLEDYPEEKIDWIGFLLLIPEVGKHGLGRQIHQIISKFAQSKGTEKIRLGVLQNNPRGLRFWQSLAYEKIAEKPRLDSEKITIVAVLELNLDENHSN